MERAQAVESLRFLLDENGLKDWHIRLIADLTKPFLGMCSYKDKCIILNSFHVDTHPDVEIINTIKHEVAHALTPNHGHDFVWAAKAKELGCDDTSPCASYSFSAEAIDAIRSGAELKVEYTEEVLVKRTPKYTVTRLQDKCQVCGKVAKEKSRFESKDGKTLVITYECGHIGFKTQESGSPFQDIVFDDNGECKGKHDWNKTVCRNCGAKRLFEYQVKGARSLERANGRLAIFDEMGLGKTIQALAYLKFHPEAGPFLWVTKSGIKFQHAKEIVRLLGWKSFPQIISTSKETLIPGMNLVASYSMFRRMDLSIFEKHGIKTLILDECQAIKNPDSTQTQCIRKIAKHCDRIIPLSGTPWKNRGSEFFVVLNMLDPKLFWSYEHFKKQWVDTYWEGNKQKEGGIRNPAKFKEHIKHLAIRRERVEVMPELPLISRTRLVCELPEAARKLYNQEADNLIKIYNDAVIGGKEDSFETHTKMMQSLMAMKQVVGIAKVPVTLEFVQEFMEDTDRKLVVFVHHKKCGELILTQMQEWCRENNCPQPLKLTADMSAEERFKVQEDFNGPSRRLLIASTLASGEGLNLQSCSDCVMHERQWNPANEEQAEGRFIRIGQVASHVTATYVHGDNSVDTDFDGIVERKRVFYTKAMSNGQVPVWNEQGVIKELIQSIVANRKKVA